MIKTNLQEKAEKLKKELAETEAQIKKEEEETKFAYKKLISFKLCCKVTGDNPKDKKFSQGSPDTNAYEMLKVCNRAINGNKKVTGIEFFPYFNKNKKPGSGFFFGYYSRWDDGCSDVSSRLALLDAERAKFSGATFEKLHYIYMVDKD